MYYNTSSASCALTSCVTDVTCEQWHSGRLVINHSVIDLYKT